MVSEAQKRATTKYVNSHYHRIPLDVKNEFYEQIVIEAEKSGKKVNTFIKEAISEKMQKPTDGSINSTLSTKQTEKINYTDFINTISTEDYSKIQKAANKLNYSVNEFILDTALDRIDSLKEYFDGRDY